MEADREEKIMKWLHVPFEDSDYEKLKEKKEDRLWRDFILELVAEEK